MQLPARIEIRNDVMGGKPCIAGTRIPVYLILQMMGAGETEAALLSAYPQLERGDIGTLSRAGQGVGALDCG